MRYFLYLSICCFLGCQTTKDQSQQKTIPSVKKAIFEAYTIEDIPVYDYSQLEPMLNKKNDTTYVVNFWATWCKPCVAELPYFETLHKERSGEAFKVILVSLDFKKKIASNLIPFLNKNKIAADVVVLSDPDANSWIDKVSENWSGAIPATIVYNKNQRAFYEQSFESQKELNDIIAPFIK